MLPNCHLLEFVDMLNELRRGTLSPQMIPRLRALQREVKYGDSVEPTELSVTGRDSTPVVLFMTMADFHFAHKSKNLTKCHALTLFQSETTIKRVRSPNLEEYLPPWPADSLGTLLESLSDTAVMLWTRSWLEVESEK